MEGEACSACALNLCGLGLNLDGFDALEAKLAALGPKERAVLTELNLSHNNLSALPPSLFHLPHLTHLVHAPPQIRPNSFHKIKSELIVLSVWSSGPELQSAADSPGSSGRTHAAAGPQPVRQPSCSSSTYVLHPRCARRRH